MRLRTATISLNTKRMTVSRLCSSLIERYGGGDESGPTLGDKSRSGVRRTRSPKGDAGNRAPTAHANKLPARHGKSGSRMGWGRTFIIESISYQETVRFSSPPVLFVPKKMSSLYPEDVLFVPGQIPSSWVPLVKERNDYQEGWVPKCPSIHCLLTGKQLSGNMDSLAFLCRGNGKWASFLLQEHRFLSHLYRADERPTSMIHDVRNNTPAYLCNNRTKPSMMNRNERIFCVMSNRLDKDSNITEVVVVEVVVVTEAKVFLLHSNNNNLLIMQLTRQA